MPQIYINQATRPEIAGKTITGIVTAYTEKAWDESIQKDQIWFTIDNLAGGKMEIEATDPTPTQISHIEHSFARRLNLTISVTKYDRYNIQPGLETINEINYELPDDLANGQTHNQR